ncbi:MAG TPA: UDP-N-acetylmuramoyl-L-alanine--D-glutamate ligase, partial [Planctomycetota bacterium]|nr:UDP-N-acetylmuramoyl-L-alanine--D-glutamate ligase [Planctomycetota bacterium]
GADKGMDFAPLVEAARARCASVILIGQTRAALAARIPGALCAETLEAALALAAERTPAGQTVLFSPACASYDMFLSFEERGERFRAGVRGLPA